jgi:threonine dehydrogenase-like Zn-dependent dehydrogenase
MAAISSIYAYCIYATDTFTFLLFCPGDYSFEKVPIPEPGPNQVLVKVKVVGICAGDGKVMDGAERFWGKPGKEPSIYYVIVVMDFF